MTLRVIEEMRPRCWRCGSIDVGTAGRSLSLTRLVQIQHYKCHKCGTTFTAGTRHYAGSHLFTDPRFVKRALRLFEQGYSKRTIAQAVSTWSGKRTPATTVQRWVQRYHAKVPAGPKPRRVSTLEKAIRKTPHPNLAVHLASLEASRRVSLDSATLRRIDIPYFDSQSELIHKARYSRWKGFSIDQCREVARGLGISMDRLERHVVSITAGKSGISKVLRTRFPVHVNGDYAFLLGLFYASGGIGGNTLHFAVDRAVGEYLGTLDLPEKPNELAQGSRQRKAHGTHSYTYGLVMLDLLKAMGLRTAKPIQLGRGKYVPSRSLTMGVPGWVRAKPAYLHRFVEGYINGLKSAAGLAGRLEEPRDPYKRPHMVVYFNFKLSFCNRNVRELRAFMRVVVSHLESLGVVGWTSHLRQDGRVMQHYSYGIHTLGQVTPFSKNFLVLRPNIRAKMSLRLSTDPVIVHILQKTRDLDNFLLGTLLEGPKTTQQVVDACPRRPYNITTFDLLSPSFKKLKELGVITRKGDTWSYDPSQFVREQATMYMERFEKTAALKAELKKSGVFYYCEKDRDVGAEPRCPKCGRLRPRGSRFELKRLWDPRAEKIALALVGSNPTLGVFKRT